MATTASTASWATSSRSARTASIQVFVLDEKPEAGLHSRWSKQGWTHCKRALSFMTLLNDGDLEGSFLLDRLPTPEEAIAIRRYCGIRQKVHHSEETVERLRAQAAQMSAKRAASEPKTGDE